MAGTSTLVCIISRTGSDVVPPGATRIDDPTASTESAPSPPATAAPSDPKKADLKEAKRQAKLEAQRQKQEAQDAKEREAQRVKQDKADGIARQKREKDEVLLTWALVLILGVAFLPVTWRYTVSRPPHAAFGLVSRCVSLIVWCLPKIQMNSQCCARLQGAATSTLYFINFGPFPAYFSALCHPTRAVCCALLGAHAYLVRVCCVF